jgi:hypothetical protein
MPKGSSIDAINNGGNHVSLSEAEKRAVYARIIPKGLVDLFNLSPDFRDNSGNDLLRFKYASGRPTVEMSLKHQFEFPDPIQYGHLTDTMNGQIHVLLYILNDPTSPRFDVDQLPNGQKTVFGTQSRNIEAEIRAMEAGLAPGQVRRGLRMLSKAIISFEEFITSLRHDIYFIEPLYYHNAVIFEHYGFAYQQGSKLMKRIQSGFSASGDLISRLDSSSPFRKSDHSSSIRLRSWSIHDGILGEPFSKVTMYKYVGKKMNINTCFDCTW